MSGKQVSFEQFQRIEQAMKNAPKVEGPLTVAEAVRKLSASTRQMRSKGYDWQQIADILRTNGLSISGDSLRRYMTPKRTAGSIKSA